MTAVFALITTNAYELGLVEVPAVWLPRDKDPDTAVGQATDIGPLSGTFRCFDHVLEPCPPSEIRPVRGGGIQRQVGITDDKRGGLEAIPGT